MEFAEKERLAKTRDAGVEAAGCRLRAARMVAGLSQEQFGAAVKKGKAAINNAENGRSFPSRDMMLLLHREHRVDFNFLIHGEFVQLPQDVQDRLFEKLSALDSERDQKPSSS
jgi:transcriptional regulator with XRE-family HTH domain